MGIKVRENGLKPDRARPQFAGYLRTNVRTLEKREQGRVKPNEQAALPISVAERTATPRHVALFVVWAGLASAPAVAAESFINTEPPSSGNAQLLAGGGSCVTTATLSQSSALTITTGNSVSCTSGSNHQDNSYFRAFSLVAFPAGFKVCEVNIGIDNANAGDPSTTQPITINIYANTGGAFPNGTRVVVGTATVQVADQNQTVLKVPVTGAVPPGAELVAEAFTPSGVATGDVLLIGSNASGESAPTYIQAAGCGIPTPTSVANVGFRNMHLVLTVAGSEAAAQTITPDPVAFGNVNVGTNSAPRSVTIGNSGTAALIISAVTSPAAPFAPGGIDTCTGQTMAAGGNCTINYVFAPAAAGPTAQTLTVTSNATAGPNTFELTGTGTLDAVQTFSPSPLDLGTSPVGIAVFGRLAIGNAGAATLNISGGPPAMSITGSNASEFAFTDHACTGQSCNPTPSTLAAGMSTNFVISCIPASEGARIASLTVRSNDPASPRTLTLNCAGQMPLIFADGFEATSG